LFSIKHLQSYYRPYLRYSLFLEKINAGRFIEKVFPVFGATADYK